MRDATAPVARQDAAPAAVAPVVPVVPRGAGDAVEYTVRFLAPHTHYIEIEGIFPVGGRPFVEVLLPVWTPGSYLVREYARNLEAVAAATIDGHGLPVTKTRKNRWRIDLGGVPAMPANQAAVERIVVRYRVYAAELSVRSSFVDDRMAVINGAPTFVADAGAESVAFDVAVELPPGWTEIVTSLPAHPSGDKQRFVAASYDVLVDSPIVAGTPVVREFAAGGVLHRLATFGGDDVWDHDRAAADLATLVQAHHAFWRQVPYPNYVFFNLAFEGSGGLEHLGSTLVLTNRFATRRRKSYMRWLGLMSHEFFHAWNVKRLRPVELGPFDYEREVHTRSLWVAEGITSYYDDLLVRRAGLINDDEYLAALSKDIGALQRTPGRAVHSLAMSSYDAWIKFYRPDENSANATVSYYTKGAVVGFLLDMAVRQASGGRRSLDDVMRAAYQRFSGSKGFAPHEFRALASEVAGRDLAGFFARAVDGTDEVDYAPALAYLGLRFASDASRPRRRDDPEPGWMGVEAELRRGRLLITSVERGSPAFTSGLNVNDELIAIDRYRISENGLASQLENYRPGDRVTVLVARRGQLREVAVTLGRSDPASWKLEVSPASTRAQDEQRRRWLTGT
jgi:predicted metalloprotease with PDZ domain